MYKDKYTYDQVLFIQIIMLWYLTTLLLMLVSITHIYIFLHTITLDCKELISLWYWIWSKDSYNVSRIITLLFYFILGDVVVIIELFIESERQLSSTTRNTNAMLIVFPDTDKLPSWYLNITWPLWYILCFSSIELNNNI